MGIVQRFERKLQGAVGDGFARVFGGSVMPQEVESALQQEATDRVQQLEGGHRLAPNSYVITVNNSDHDALASDRDLTVRAFSRHLEDFIRDQGWQTYGPVQIAFEPSEALHTGQFRTRGSVDPDAGRPPIAHATSNPGAGPMTQNPGYDPSRDPAAGRRPEPEYARNGHAHVGQDQRYAQDGPAYQNGYDRGAGYEQPAYPPQNPGYSAPAAPAFDQQVGRADEYDYDPNYRDPNFRDAGYQQQDYPAAYDQAAPARYPDGSYADPGYQQPAYDQPAYDQQAYDPGYQQGGYAQPGYQQGGYDQQAYDPGYQQGGYQPGGYSQEPHVFTATLQLEDGSGRHFQLREGNNIIGRGQEAQFRLPDTGVSRRHIDIRWDGQVAMLSDLGSTNGTTVNGAPVQDWQLADGDIIRAGHSEILVRIL
ncbi:FhaA domain-containing protein [Rhodococcus sp. NPDC058521]|uniref:FhaA domain-containing protein n=1 Tax=Rhodococcus sp. NPDC058521 TaxID=3346536 RepID=UPI003647DAF5